MSRLTARGLRIERAGRLLVENLDLDVGPADSVAVTGPSASGKTSLLAALAGLAQPQAGTVVTDPPDHRSVGVVLQGFGLVSLLSAAENIEVALRAAGADSPTAAATTAEVLAEVGLTDLADHLVEELSGGQQQRVAVARALAARPAVLIADEPTAEQDEATRATVLDRLFAVAERGGALVLATHDPEVAARCSREIRIGRPG